MPTSALATLWQLPADQGWSEAEFTHQLNEHLPKVGEQHRRRIREAATVAAYHAQQGFPVVDLLVCDDADQLKRLTDALALCWVHDGRHYKKLEPVVPDHRIALEDFREKY